MKEARKELLPPDHMSTASNSLLVMQMLTVNHWLVTGMKPLVQRASGRSPRVCYSVPTTPCVNGSLELPRGGTLDSLVRMQ
jgi:hypothetical protein